LRITTGFDQTIGHHHSGVRTAFFPYGNFFLRNKPTIFTTGLPWARTAICFQTWKQSISCRLFSKPLVFIKNFTLFLNQRSLHSRRFLLFQPITLCLFALFCLGVIHFFITPNRKTRHLGLFFGGCLLTWWILVPLKQFPYTPSRHTLILLPFFCVTIAEGLDGLRRLFKKTSLKYPRHLFDRGALAASLTILILFISFIRSSVERKNPIQKRSLRINR
jgi:hypothetical protein